MIPSRSALHRAIRIAASVVLWTRLAPDPLNGGGMPDDDVEVTWEVSDSADFATIVASGVETATLDAGHSVHAIARRWIKGRGSTDFVLASTPARSARPAPLPMPAPIWPAATFAVGELPELRGRSVRRAPRSRRALARLRRVPRRLHLRGRRRSRQRRTRRPACISARNRPRSSDYRNRYARYKSDPHLQAAHAACPWFVIWDDHEVENNYAGLTPQDAADAPTFPTRRFAAYQAWWEHQPVRLDPPVDRRPGISHLPRCALGRPDRSGIARRTPVPHRPGLRRRDVEPRSAVCRGPRSGADDAGRRTGDVVVRHACRVDGDLERDRESSRAGRLDVERCGAQLRPMGRLPARAGAHLATPGRH